MSSTPPLSITIERRFRGPERSGNGGYTAGRLAAALIATTPSYDGSPVTVTLRRPPPLDTELSIRPTDHDDPAAGLDAWHDDLAVATAVFGTFTSTPVSPVDFATATAARSSYRGAEGHPFPGCFVCGPARQPADGLRLTPGLVGPGRTACVWVPDPSLVTGDDPTLTGAEFAWAALDCPGGWTSDLERRPVVLGRMTASCERLPRVGQPHVVVGELLSESGRKTHTATSLYDDGRLVGHAEHTWIAVDPQDFNG